MKKTLTLLMFSFTLLFGIQEIHSQNSSADQRANEKTIELEKVLKFKKTKFDDVHQAYKTYETGLQTIRESANTKKKVNDKNAIVSERKKLKNDLDARLQQILTPEEFQKYLGVGAK